MEHIILYTQAYNAASTLKRTIDSVKGQTHTDWTWLIVDNCSSDGTGSIIMREALQDTRIIPFRIQPNNIAAYVKFWLILKKNFPDCYFMQLDADDTISPDCLESLLDFVRQNELDIAACGTEFIKPDNSGVSQVSGIRNLESDLILEGTGFADHFRLYRSFTNELWAKLYNFSVITEDSLAVYSGHHYDSQIVLQLFRAAKKVGILSKPLHQAYLGGSTLSAAIKGISGQGRASSPLEEQVFHWLDGTAYVRHVSYGCGWPDVNATYGAYKAFLECYGPLTTESREYLYAIYIGWIHENLVQFYLAFAPAGNHGLFSNLLGLLCSEVFQEVFTYIPQSDEFHNLKLRGKILTQMYNFISICEYNVNDMEFVKRAKDVILQLKEALPE